MNTTVTSEEIAERIARLEAETEEPKREFAKLDVSCKPVRLRTLADLAGIFKGEMDDVTLEDIKNFEYKSRLDRDPCP